MATDVVVIFALDREAAPFRAIARRDRLPVRVLVSGVGPGNARRTAEGVGTAGLVISAGFCGALNPALRVGDVGVCTMLYDGEPSGVSRRVCDATLRLTPLGSPYPVLNDFTLLTVPQLVATPEEKRLLRERTFADVVDMEAAHVRAACVARDLPFLAVKAVSDAADTALSPRLVRLLAGGRVSPVRAAASLLVQPSLAGEFRRLALDTRLAADRLAHELWEIVTCRGPAGRLR